jgi:S-DNA-T family DNA segregation ATPase FtsK/SpoIIIE
MAARTILPLITGFEEADNAIMKLRSRSCIIAAALSLAGLVCFVCLIFFLQAPDGVGWGRSPGTALGSFFFRSFHYAAFFIPLYFWICAFLLMRNPFRLDLLILLNYLMLPFFTLGISLRLFTWFRVYESPVTAFFASSFSRIGSAILTALLFLLELTIIPQFALRLRRRFYPLRENTAALLLAAPPDTEAEGENPETAVPERDRAFLPLLEEDSALAKRPLSAERVLALPDPASEETNLFPETGLAETLPYEEIPDDDSDDTEAGGEIDEEPGSGDLFPEDTPSSLSDSPPPPRKNRKKAYRVPTEGILTEYADGKYWEVDEETRRAGDVLRATLEEFKIQAEVVGIRKGPVITMFEILPAPGVKLSKIVNLADNIALRLAASSVRIVAPIPGKHAVGIEIPNKHRAIVSFAELINAEKFSALKMEIPLALGKDISGEAQIVDLVGTPHLLIAGATGSGKSVCVNSIICSILYRKPPEEVKLILIDPKIVELKFYNDVPHLLTPVITEPKRAFQALQYAIYEMERRYALLDSLGVRDIRSYNRKIDTKHIATTPLPYLVIIIDEFADLMATTGKELESTLARLAAMSRAVGIHLILATQRPSIDVITGLIKANIPSRIAFMVAGKFDSRIIIDAVGAEKLLGRGDMLFAPSWNPFPLRMQGAYLSEEEVEKVVAYVKTLGEPDYIDDEIFIDEDDEEDFFEEDEEDPLMDKGIEIVTAAGKASASYLQRRLKIGYNRAARMVEAMERRGIVGPPDGSKPRRVIGGQD